MQFRLWNSFNLLAVVLLGIGIIGGIRQGHMVFDPGRLTSGKEWIIYVLAGVLMLVNGLLPPSTASAQEEAGSKTRRKPEPEK